jgi:hypothetical protein
MRFDCTDLISHSVVRTPMTAYLLHLIGGLLGTRRLGRRLARPPP